MPPLEAMAAETPVAASKISAIPEVCSNAVQYFDPRDVNDMAVKISELLTDENLRKKLVEAGKRRTKLFSWDDTAEKTLEIYDSILKYSA